MIQEMLPVIREVVSGSIVFVNSVGKLMCLFIYDTFDKLVAADRVRWGKT